MDVDALWRNFEGASFQHAVWFFPPAFALHVLEEAPRFTRWARRYASKRFTHRDFVRNNALGMASGLILCAAVSFFPHPALALAFFALVVWQAGFNTLFHVATTAAYGVYSPGLITSLTLYPALCWHLSRLAHRDGVLSDATGAAAFITGGVLHAYVVAVQVYFVRFRFRRPRNSPAHAASNDSCEPQGTKNG